MGFNVGTSCCSALWLWLHHATGGEHSPKASTHLGMGCSASSTMIHHLSGHFALRSNTLGLTPGLQAIQCSPTTWVGSQGLESWLPVSQSRHRSRVSNQRLQAHHRPSAADPGVCGPGPRHTTWEAEPLDQRAMVGCFVVGISYPRPFTPMPTGSTWDCSHSGYTPCT